MADRVGRHERAVEVDALDERVDGQHLDAIPLRLDHRRIVADADEQPVRRRRRRRPRMRAIELALGAVGNGHFA